MTQYNLYVSKGKKWKVKIIWTKAVSPASHPNTQHTHKKKDKDFMVHMTLTESNGEMECIVW